jgi:DNA-binding CsgD family transcriptional regulator
MLTPREYEIFRLMGRGLQSKEIGEALGITPLTLQSHRKNIALKIGTTGNGLTQQALRHYHATLGVKD